MLLLLLLMLLLLLGLYRSCGPSLGMTLGTGR
jgi:hypothetical protein